jgi:hypothetical protein
MDSTDTPLAVDCLHGGRDRQRRRRSPKQVHKQAGPLGGVRARLAICHRAIPVRAAIRREVAQPTIDGVKRTIFDGGACDQNEATSYDGRTE